MYLIRNTLVIHPSNYIWKWFRFIIFNYHRRMQRIYKCLICVVRQRRFSFFNTSILLIIYRYIYWFIIDWLPKRWIIYRIYCSIWVLTIENMFAKICFMIFIYYNFLFIIFNIWLIIFSCGSCSINSYCRTIVGNFLLW